MTKSILFLGNISFDTATHNGKIINDEDISKYERIHNVKVEYMIYVHSVDMVISHDDVDFLCNIGEDYITGENETSMNPYKLTIDSYFVDTLCIDEVITHDDIHYYTQNIHGEYFVFDGSCKLVHTCDSEDKLLLIYPSAKRMQFISVI